MTPTWRDLSDDELEARLVPLFLQRGFSGGLAQAWVRYRDLGGMDEAIDRILGDER